MCSLFYHNHFHIVQKPDLVNLQAFPFQIEGSRNIVARAASQYKCIGAILLNDKDGTLISGLTASSDQKEIMHKIFEKWVREDTQCSWQKLINCMKECELIVLAQQMDDALQLNPHHVQGLNEQIFIH